MKDTDVSRLTGDAFSRGYMCACAGLARDHGEDTYAEFLLGEAGFTLADARRIKLDSYDLKPLRPIFARLAEPRRPRPQSFQGQS